MSERASWLKYEFTVYSPAQTKWTDVAGIYIFCGLKTRTEWEAFYIGQTDSFAETLATHPQWAAASRLGATHIHAMTMFPTAKRNKIERELIQACQPPLNTPPK
jgi:hypothetical protein